jgi:hypothetical protein
MPKKRPGNPRRSPKQDKRGKPEGYPASYEGHIQYYVGDEIRAAVEACTLSPTEVVVQLLQLSDGGYRFSVEYDYNNQAYAGSLFQRDPTMTNAGMILAARHADMDKCLTLLYVLHFEVFQQVWFSEDILTSKYTW